MLVECIFNKVSSISSGAEQYIKDYIHDDEICLDIGRKYQVYGVAFRNGSPWFYILEDGDVTSLRLHFSGLFKLLSGTLPQNWEYCESGHSEKGVALLPAEWARSPGFYEALIDEDENAITIFSRICESLMPTTKQR